MKTRILALLLVLMLVLCGCGKEETIAGDLTPATRPTAETDPTQAASAESMPTEPAPTEAPVSLGTLEGGTYINSYAGFGFTLDENWTIYPADQLQDLPDNVSAMFDGTEFESYDITTIMDVMAENVNDLTTMNVLYQKLSMQERVAYLAMDETDILDMMLNDYYDTLVASYENAGILVESMSTKAVTFLGEDRTALYTVATVQEIPYYVLQLYDFHLGQFSITTTVGSYYTDNTESLLELFFPAE